MTKDEKIKVQSILSEYKSCHDRIEILEEQITNLLDTKNQLVDELHEIRSNEMRVVSELQTKYGDEASINLEKLEIVNGKA